MFMLSTTSNKTIIEMVIELIFIDVLKRVCECARIDLFKYLLYFKDYVGLQYGIIKMVIDLISIDVCVRARVRSCVSVYVQTTTW